MELRRAILLFAIVLGLAAIVSSIARPPDRGDKASDEPAEPTSPAAASRASPKAGTPQPTTIRLRTRAKPSTLKLEVGRPTTLVVDVETAGQVDIPSLGLTEAAEPLTPATFDLLATRTGEHSIVVQPAASETLRSKVGTLTVVRKRSDRSVAARENGR